MLKISKMADYATIIMVYCAEHQDRDLSASEIAHHTQLKLPTVSKLLKKLTRASLLMSHRGAQGGYQLALPVEKISVAAIVASIDGAIALTECNQSSQGCELERHCVTRTGWRLINKAVADALERVLLIDMLAGHSVSFAHPRLKNRQGDYRE